MDKILSVYKPGGVTPLQLIKMLRKKYPEYKDIKIGYAGRLDPLAYGLMLLTIGEENKNRRQYLNLGKTYKFSVLFGVETDSYDYLGILKDFKVLALPDDFENKIKIFIKANTGIISQPYPPFSSKTVNGIPLYKLAKKGKLNYADLPVREVKVFRFKLISIEKMNSQKIRAQTIRNLRKIKGHFRQGMIIKQWNQFFKDSPEQEFTLANFEIDCGSGTYIRSLAQRMGKEFGCGAIAFEIFRTKVGKFNVEDAFKVTT